MASTLKTTTPEERHNMRLAITSACWCALPQVMVKDSGIIAIFAMALLVFVPTVTRRVERLPAL